MSADSASDQPFAHYTNAVDEIERRQREGRADDAEELLLWCIEYIEREAAEHGRSPTPWYYRQLADLYRAQDRHTDERALLDRYAETCEQTGVSLAADLRERRENLPEEADVRPRSYAAGAWLVALQPLAEGHDAAVERDAVAETVGPDGLSSTALYRLSFTDETPATPAQLQRRLTTGVSHVTDFELRAYQTLLSLQ